MKRYNVDTILFLFFILFVSCSKGGKDDTEIDDPIVNDPNPELINVRQLNFPSEKYIMVAAHRGGYKGKAPENSLKAIKKSLDLGVDIIEIDVRITVDNKLAVIHDKTLDRTTTGTGKVSHHTLDEITALNLKDENGNVTEEKVPTLKEVMNLVGNKAIVFIDKAELVIDKVEAALNETKSSKQALFMDFVNVEEAASRYGDLLKTSFFVPAIHESISSLDTYYSDFKNVFDPNPCAMAFWFKNESVKPFSMIGKAKNDNIPVWINTTTDTQSAGHTDAVSLTNPDEGWGWALDQGANIIFTEYPKELINYLTTKDLR